MFVLFIKFCRRFMVEILSIQRKTLSNQSYKVFCFILIRLLAIDIVANLNPINETLKQFKTATLHLIMISTMLIRKIQGQHHIENMKSACNWHTFEFKKQRISSLCIKWRYVILVTCITSSFLNMEENISKSLEIWNYSPLSLNWIQFSNKTLTWLLSHWFGSTMWWSVGVIVIPTMMNDFVPP